MVHACGMVSQSSSSGKAANVRRAHILVMIRVRYVVDEDPHISLCTRSLDICGPNDAQGGDTF